MRKHAIASGSSDGVNERPLVRVWSTTEVSRHHYTLINHLTFFDSATSDST